MPRAKKSAERKAFVPSDFFSLQDIFLWEMVLRRQGDHQSHLDVEKSTLQTRRSVTPLTFKASIEGIENEADLLRALVKFGLRSIAAPMQDRPEIVHFELEATFAVDYLVLRAPSSDDFAGFVEQNCVHNAWPFWRQHVYDTLKRASLPVPSIPLFCMTKKS